MIDPLKGHFRSHVCPYCFHEFLLSDTPYRCANPEGRLCPPEIDAARQRVWEHGTYLPRVVRPPLGLFAQQARCGTCKTVTRQRLCPHCHLELPLSFGQRPGLILAVVGAKESGKSHFLAVLITQLRKHLSAEMNFALEPANDDVQERFQNDFYRPVYEEHQPIVATQSGRRSASRVRQPLIYDLNLLANGRGRPFRRGITLVFFDTAGEDLDREETMNVANRYLCHADGIILLLDPLQLPAVRDRFQDERLLPAANSETSELLGRIIRLIRKGRRRPRGKIPIPLALAFSKFDAVRATEGLVGSQLQLCSDSSHDGGFNLADCEAVNDEMQSLLASWDGTELIQQVHSSFQSFAFFGLSALGCNPHRERKILNVLPNRIEDPFFWLLYRHEILKKK